MNIALIGATGFVGSAVLQELLQRAHRVTALSRTPRNIPTQAGLTATSADVLDAAQVAEAVHGHDAVISAYNPGWNEPDLYHQFLLGSTAIVEGVKRAGVARLLVVGGAGSLQVAPGVQLVDTPSFRDHVPPNVVPGALAARDALTALRREQELAWTFVSPPAGLQAGVRSGRYRLGTDDLLMDGDRPAGISVRDLAVAIVDEIETPRHLRQRFTAAAA